MKSKLAIWSWILPVLSWGLSGLGILFFSDNTSFGPILPEPEIWLVIIWVSVLVGLIFGIIALRRISRNSQLAGRTHAIAGVILNLSFILLSLFFNLYRF